MPANIALVLCLAFSVYILVSESKWRPIPSHAIWIPIIWMVLIGSRYTGQWLSLLGMSKGLSSLNLSPDAILDGSPLDRNIFLILIISGLIVLINRKVNFGSVIRRNKAIAVFFLLCLISILWSDFPFVALKRWFKNFGNIVMVLVVLTDPYPMVAIKALLKRTAYILIPLSFIFIKYFSQFGRYYSIEGISYYCGVATDKNMLGNLLLVCGLFFLWDTYFRLMKKTFDSIWQIALYAVMLLIILWQLKLANSATSLATMSIGLIVVVIVNIPIIKRNISKLSLFIVIFLVTGYVLQMIFGITEIMVAHLGRDMTFTTRSFLWQEVLVYPINPLIGTGYESFWLGARRAYFWNLHWWHPIQAHNGYIETYLNLGLIGIGMLVIMLLSVYRKISRFIANDLEFGSFRLAFFVVTLLYNMTEASFYGLGIVWFMFLLVAIDQPFFITGEMSNGNSTETESKLGKPSIQINVLI